MWKKGIRWFIAIVLFVSLGISTFLFFNKNFIKNQLIQSLNKQLSTEVKVNGAIDLSLFKHFPQLSLVLENVYIQDALRNDTLANVEEISLQLDVLKILRKNYQIDGISVDKGFVKLYTSVDGLNNFDILKQQESSSSSLLQLDHIELNQISIQYHNEKAAYNQSIFTKNTVLKGQFYEQNFEIELNTNFLNHNLIINDASVLTNKHIDADLTIGFNKENDCFTITKQELIIEENRFEISGNICQNGQTIECQAKATGSHLEHAIALIPNQWMPNLPVTGDGEYMIDCVVKGSMPNPNLIISFQINNGNAYVDTLSTEFSDIQLKGTFISDKNKKSLSINHFQLAGLSSQISGQIHIADLSKNQWDFTLNGDIDAETINHLQKDIVDLEKGKIHINTLHALALYDRKDSSFTINDLEGNIQLNEIEGEFIQKQLPFTLNGDLSGISHFLSTQNLIFTSGKNHLSFTGEFKNLLEIVLNAKSIATTELVFEGNLYSEYFNINDFISNESNDNSSAKTPAIPDLNGSLSVRIDEFQYEKLVLNNLTIQADAFKKNYTFNIKKAEGLAGSLSAFLNTQINENQFEINLQSQLKGIQIDQLLAAFNNFDNTTLTNKNVKGQLDGQIQFSGVWNNFSDFDTKSMLLESEIIIKDGELINFSPLMSLSGKLNVDQLQHLYFSDLTTRISIKDEILSMPLTEINSNLLSLQTGGTYRLDDYLDFNLILNLKNLLAAKFKKERTLDEDYVNDIFGGINIYIKMTGPIDDIKVQIDKDSIKKKIKQDFKDEKKEFKNLFKKGEVSEFEGDDINLSPQDDDDKYLDWED